MRALRLTLVLLALVTAFVVSAGVAARVRGQACCTVKE
jgi:hypothetical protein